MEHLVEFNRDLLHELREQESETDLPLGDLAFERFCVPLEIEGELETADRCGWRGSFAGKSLRIDGHGGDPRESEGVLSVVVCELFEEDAPVTLNAADAKKLFGHLFNFVTSSVKREFREALHLETSEFGAATMIADAWSKSAITKVKLILVTNGLYSARTDAVLAAKLPGKSGEIPVTYNIWDLKRLHRAETTGSKEKIVVRFAEEFGGALPALAASGPETAFPSYLAVIKGRQLADIYEKWGARLLESNIRSFIQARRKSVNEGIRNTIRDEPEMFFSYNNGLSATADGVETEADGAGFNILSARNLQIVNGGQTTASLHAALRSNADRLDRVHVQIKLTVVPPEQSEAVVPSISKFANSQNKINAADFFSNHPFHVRIEDYSRAVNAPPVSGASGETRWFYERARGQYQVERAKLASVERRAFDRRNPKQQLFAKTDLAKVELSFRMEPHVVSKGAQKAFAAFATDIGETWDATGKQYDQVWFKRLVAKLIIFRALEKAVPRQDWYPGGYRANIVTYGIAKLVHDAKEKAKEIDLDRVWSEQAVSEGLMAVLLTACEAAADQITQPQSGVQNITEWAKKQGCWAAVQRADVPWGKEFNAVLIDPAAAKAAQRDGQQDEAVVSGIRAQELVLEKGGAFWDRLRVWTRGRPGFTFKDEGALKACSKMETVLPAEWQCIRAISVLNRARSEGYIDDEETPRIRISVAARTH